MLIGIIGGLLIFSGSMIYNGFIILPFCGMQNDVEESLRESRYYPKFYTRNLNIEYLDELTKLEKTFSK